MKNDLVINLLKSSLDGNFPGEYEVKSIGEFEKSIISNLKKTSINLGSQIKIEVSNSVLCASPKQF